MSYARKLRNNDWYQMALLKTFLTLGNVLLIIVASILLLGCCPEPVVIREKAPPYPLPDSSLMLKPKNQDLGEKWLSPSNDANNGSIGQPKTPLK